MAMMALRNRLLQRTPLNAVPRRYAQFQHNATEVPTNPYNRFVLRTKEAVEHDINEAKKWQKITLVMSIVCFTAGLYVYNHPEEHHPRTDFSFMKIRSKEFPWGDGDTSLFDHLFNKKTH